MRRLVTGAVIGACVWTASLAAQQPTPSGLHLTALSARPDLVTGGDVLVQVDGARPGRVMIRLNGANVTAAFRMTPTRTLVGLVTGLRAGANTIEASAPGSKAPVQLAVVNHAITGPLIYSPHQTPFACETAEIGRAHV